MCCFLEVKSTPSGMKDILVYGSSSHACLMKLDSNIRRLEWVSSDALQSTMNKEGLKKLMEQDLPVWAYIYLDPIITAIEMTIKYKSILRIVTESFITKYYTESNILKSVSHK